MNLALLQESAIADLAQSSASAFWLWFTAGAFILATVWFIYLSTTGRAGQYHHYVASTVITFWAALWYIVMASGSGISLVTGTGGETRLFYYARYIDWTLTTPLLLLGLAWIALGGRLSRAPGLAAGIVVADVVMILTGVAGGATGSNFKWFWFVISTIAFLIVLGLLWGPLRAQMNRYEPEGGPRLFYTLAGMLTVLWVLYPIVWIVGTEGVGAVPASVEVFFYAVLDILAKIAFGAMLLGGIRGQAPSSVLGSSGQGSGGGQGRASRVS